MPRSRGFEYWFGGIDLNSTPKDLAAAGDPEAAGVSSSHNADHDTQGVGPSNTGDNVHPGVGTGVMLSSDNSGGEAEVQSMAEEFATKTAYARMVFE
jgi:hypothetical protein